MIIGAACALGIFMGAVLDFSGNSNGLFNNSKKEKLARLIDYIEYEYVDEVNTDSIVNVAIDEILKNLDPHSVYISGNDYEQVSRKMNGDFVGIGIMFYKIQDSISVSQIIPKGPAEKAGIKAGDQILYANGTQLFGKGLGQDSLLNLLKGPIGSKVHLKIKRGAKKELLDFTIERDVVSLKSVTASYRLCDHLGYIKIDRFAETTSDEFHHALQNLLKKGITKLVLDLRDNGGGYLQEAVAIADEFLPEGKLILFTKNKSGNIEKTFATEEGTFEHGKLYVLLNEKSASASEIVAGALQDNDVGTIVGRRSFGKGLVQKEMKLGDGSAVRLTVARYYTPTGRSIQRSYENGTEAYYSEYLDRYKNGELVHADSIEVNDSLKFVTPDGKTVYGGGGIIPDIFVPKDISYKKEQLDYMLHAGLMERFVFGQLEQNREYYEQLSFSEFKTTVFIEEKMLTDYVVYLEQFHISFEVRDDYAPVLRTYLKATMAQQLFGSNASVKLLNQHDKMIEKTKILSTCNADTVP